MLIGSICIPGILSLRLQYWVCYLCTCLRDSCSWLFKFFYGWCEQIRELFSRKWWPNFGFTMVYWEHKWRRCTYCDPMNSTYIAAGNPQWCRHRASSYTDNAYRDWHKAHCDAFYCSKFPPDTDNASNASEHPEPPPTGTVMANDPSVSKEI